MAYRKNRSCRFKIVVMAIVLLTIIALALFCLWRGQQKEPWDPNGSLGVGVWIYDLNQAEGGDIKAIVAKAKKYRLGHIIVCADRGGRQFNDREKVKELFALCCDAGILPIAYQRCFGNDTEAELNAACQTIEDGAVFYIFDMEGEYEGKDNSEKMEAVLLPFRLWVDKFHSDCLIGVSTFGLRNYHADFPWEVTFKYCDMIWPQYYWSSWEEGQGWDIKKSLSLIATDWGEKYAEREDAIPVVPTLQAYGRDTGFTPTDPKELETMLKKLDTPLGINIFRWELMDQSHWDVIKRYTEPKPKRNFWRWLISEQPPPEKVGGCFSLPRVIWRSRNRQRRYYTG